MMNENEILASKLELLAKAIRGEIEIEMPIDMGDYTKWFKFNYEGGYLFKTDGVTWNIQMILDCLLIREVVKIPLLTDEECVYLSFYPHDWFASRGKSGDTITNVYLSDKKPTKGDLGWVYGISKDIYIGRGTTLTFDDIKWSDKDCYTIGELIAHSRENRK